MKAFMNRINATLPTEKPDHILLALVQGYRDRVCGIACPAGQGLAEDGRCLPNAVLARATKGALQRGKILPTAEPARAPAIIGWSTTTTAPPTLREPGEERMTLAGPPAEQAKATPVAPTAATQTARPHRVAVPRQSEPPSKFGPAFFKQRDALGLF